MSELAIQTRGLVKSYSSRDGGERKSKQDRLFNAVDGLDLDIIHGEIFGLLGPNGAGKSTTVEMLEGYRDRTKGSISVLGEDPQRPSATWRSKIGIVLQSTKDLSSLTVRESLTTFAASFAQPRPIDEVIELIGLTDKADTRGSSLSGGLRRRLDVGLGIIGNPELLFLDEPTTGFDPDARRQFWALIQSLNAQGTTILLTSHYLDEVEYLAHRVAVITKGQLVALDTPDRLGGRQGAKAVVSYRDANGSLSRIDTDEPTKVVTELAAMYGELAELTVKRPSLEDVYLDMIGRDLDE